jgi:hypothetical protein
MVNDRHAIDPQELALWQCARAAPSPSGACPPQEELAAWIDGRLPAARRELLEGHLAACPECLEAVADIRVILAGPMELPPPAVVESALALVSPPKALRLPDWRSAGGWALRLAASIAVCVTAWRAGSIAFASGDAPAETLESEISFGMFDGHPQEWAIEALGVAIEEVRP